jgi:hypothetical protein
MIHFRNVSLGRVSPTDSRRFIATKGVIMVHLCSSYLLVYQTFPQTWGVGNSPIHWQVYHVARCLDLRWYNQMTMRQSTSTNITLWYQPNGWRKVYGVSRSAMLGRTSRLWLGWTTVKWFLQGGRSSDE